MEWASNSLNIFLLDSSSVNFVYQAPPPPAPIKWTFFARKLVERHGQDFVVCKTSKLRPLIMTSPYGRALEEGSLFLAGNRVSGDNQSFSCGRFDGRMEIALSVLSF